MTDIRIEVHDAAVQAVLKRIQQRMKNMRPVMADIGDELVSLTDQRFLTQTDPWGRAWTPLRPSTIRSRRKSSGAPEILQDRGHLRSSYSAHADSTSVVVGTNIPHAAIHQFGGVFQRRLAAGSVRLRTTASGALLKRGNLAVFANQGKRKKAKRHKRFVERAYAARDYQITIPARPMLPIRNGTGELPGPYQARVLMRMDKFIAGAVQ